MDLKSTVLKTETKNNKTVALLKSCFGNFHIAVWDGVGVNDYENFNSLPCNFNQTASYGNNLEWAETKFYLMLANTKMENWKNVK